MPGLFDYFRQIVVPQPKQTVPPPQLQVQRAPIPPAAAAPTPIQPTVVQPQSAQSAAIAARYGTKYAGYEDLITTRPGGGYDLRAADAAIAADLRKQEVSSLSGYGLTRYQFQQAGEAKRQAVAEIQAARGDIMRQQALLPRYQQATEREWQLGIQLERGWLRGEIPPTGPTPPKVSRGVLQIRGEMPAGVLPPAMTPITAIPKGEFKQPSGGFDLFGSWAALNRRVADITGLSRLPEIPAGITKGWGVVYRAAIAPTPLGLGLIAAEGLTRKPSLVIEAQKEYFPELYRGIREQPMTMAAWAGVGLVTGAAVESRTIAKIGTQFPRLAKGVQLESKVLTGLYTAYSGARVITSQRPGTELAKIMATEVTPLYLGSAAYRPLKQMLPELSPFQRYGVGRSPFEMTLRRGVVDPLKTGYGRAQYVVKGAPSRLDILASETGLAETGAIPPSTLKGRIGEVIGDIRISRMKPFTEMPKTPFDIRFEVQRPMAGGERLQLEAEARAQYEFEMSPAGWKRVLAEQDILLQKMSPETVDLLGRLRIEQMTESTLQRQIKDISSLRVQRGRPTSVSKISTSGFSMPEPGPWPGRVIAKQIVKPVITYDVPILAQERVFADVLAPPRPAPVLTTRVFGFTPLLPGVSSKLVSDQRISSIRSVGFASISSVIGLQRSQVQAQSQIARLITTQIPSSIQRSKFDVGSILTPISKIGTITIPRTTTMQRTDLIITPRFTTIHRTDYPITPRFTTIHRTDYPITPRFTTISRETPPPVIRFGRTIDPFGHGGGGKRRPLGAFRYRKWQAVLMPSKVLSFKVKNLDFAFGGKPRKGTKKPKRIRI